MEKINLKVKGMVCTGCENRVKNALSIIDGVENVEADYKTGMVVITLSKDIKIQDIEEKIDDLGFEITKED